jgi:hypothetical protein
MPVAMNSARRDLKRSRLREALGRIERLFAPSVLECESRAREKTMSKYSALRRRLEREAGPSVEMTFEEIDHIVGCLRASARRYSAWWSNERDGTHVQDHAWMDAGWRVENVNLTAENVRFTHS